MKRRFWFFALPCAFLMTLCLSPVEAQKGNKGAKSYFVRAQFRDELGSMGITDRVRSDGVVTFTCEGLEYDYVDIHEECSDRIHKSGSWVSDVGDSYFLATRGSEDPEPNRWLVLDFGANNDEFICPDLDTALSDYPGRNPDAFSPVQDGCVDLVEVRFFADDAFKSGATSSTVRILIDGPDLVKTKGGGTTTRWNTKFELDFVNPVTRSGDGNIVTLEASGDGSTAELWTIGSNLRKQTFVGIFSMPFQVTLTKTDQIFQ